MELTGDHRAQPSKNNQLWIFLIGAIGPPVCKNHIVGPSTGIIPVSQLYEKKQGILELYKSEYAQPIFLSYFFRWRVNASRATIQAARDEDTGCTVNEKWKWPFSMPLIVLCYMVPVKGTRAVLHMYVLFSKFWRGYQFSQFEMRILGDNLMGNWDVCWKNVSFKVKFLSLMFR